MKSSILFIFSFIIASLGFTVVEAVSKATAKKTTIEFLNKTMLVSNLLAQQELESIKTLKKEPLNTLRKNMKAQYLKSTRTHLNTSFRALKELQKLSKKRIYDVQEKNNYMQLSAQVIKEMTEGMPEDYDCTPELGNEYHESFSHKLKELQSTLK